MIDGFKIYYRVNDFEAWCKATNIGLYIPMERETGAVKEKKRHYSNVFQSTITYNGKFETYFLTIKEVHKTINNQKSLSHLLIIDGSLHKNHFGGTNYLRFTWQDLQLQVTHMEEKLCLICQNSELVNLEFGANIEVDFPVYEFLRRNLISYKGNTFNRYAPDKNGVCLGFICELCQYSVKVYDKGIQNNLPYNLMRFELRYLRMEKLKRLGIKYLSNLKEQNKVFGLLSLLIEAWDNVLLYDHSINLTVLNLTPKEKELLQNGYHDKFWENLKEKNNRRFNHYRNKFKMLVATHGKNVHKTIKDLIIKEWQNLFKKCTNLLHGKKENLYKMTVKVKCQNVQKPISAPGDAPEPEQPIKRYCLSCGRDISNQNSRSRFCSSKFVGEKEAHRCRNKNSNQRNNFKRKIERINSKGVLFDVVPFIVSVPKRDL